MATEVRHSAVCTPRRVTDSRVAKIASNILARRPLISQTTAYRAAEGLAGAQVESEGMSYLLHGDRTQRDFQRSLDGSMNLPYVSFANLPEHGYTGTRVALALITPVLRDCAVPHHVQPTQAETHPLDAASAGFLRVSSDYAARYITAVADGALTAEERRDLLASIAEAQAWLNSLRAAVGRG